MFSRKVAKSVVEPAYARPHAIAGQLGSAETSISVQAVLSTVFIFVFVTVPVDRSN